MAKQINPFDDPDLLADFSARLGSQITAAPEKKPEGSWFDPIASFGAGAGSLVSGVGTFLGGSDSTIAELGYSAQDYWGEKKSARLKAEEADLSKRISEGDWSGAGGKVLSSPFLAANMLAGSAPAMAAGMGAGGLVARGMAGAGAMTNAAGQLTRAGGAVASGIGEGAFIATDVYEATKGNLAAAGAAGVLLGVGVSAITPGSIGGAYARKVAGTADDGLTVASQAVTGGAAALGREGMTYAAARAGRTGAQEFSQEFVQEGGQALIEQLGRGEELNFKSAAAAAVVGGILGAQTGVSLHPFVGEGSKAAELQDAMRAKQAIEQLGQAADPVSEQQRLQALRIADARVDVLKSELAVVEKRGEATEGEKLAVDAAHAREEAARNPADDLARSKASLLTITSQIADIPAEQRTPTQVQAAKVAELEYLAAKNPDNQDLKDQADTAKAAMLLNETSPDAVREGANKAARVAQTAILEAPTLDLALQDFSRGEEASAVGRTVVGGLTSTLKGVEQAAAQTLSDTYDENSEAQKAEEKAILEAQKAQKQAQKDAIATAQQETKVAKLNQERVKLGLPTIDASMVPEAETQFESLDNAPPVSSARDAYIAEYDEQRADIIAAMPTEALQAQQTNTGVSQIARNYAAEVLAQRAQSAPASARDAFVAWQINGGATQSQAEIRADNFMQVSDADLQRTIDDTTRSPEVLAYAREIARGRAPAAARTPRTSMTVAEAERRLRTMLQADGDSQQRIDETVANLRREAATGDVAGIEAVARGFESRNDHRPAEFLRALLDEREAGGTTAATAPVPGSTQDIQNRRAQAAQAQGDERTGGVSLQEAIERAEFDGLVTAAINAILAKPARELADITHDLQQPRTVRELAYVKLVTAGELPLLTWDQLQSRENELEAALDALTALDPALTRRRLSDKLATMSETSLNLMAQGTNSSGRHNAEQARAARVAIAFRNKTHLGNVDQFITSADATPAAAPVSGLSRAEIESEYESALEDWADNMGSTVSVARRHVEGLSDARVLQGLDDPDLAPYMLPIAQYRNLPIPDYVLNPPPADTREVESDFTQRAMKALRNGTLNKLGAFWREVMQGRGQRVFNIDTSDLAYRHDNYYDIEQSSLDELKDRYNDELNRQAQRWARENNQPLTTLINPIVAIDVGNGSIGIKVHSLGRQGQNPYAVPANDTNTGVAWMDKDDGHMTTTGLASAKGSSNLAYRLAAEIARMAGENVPAASSLLTNNRMRRHMQSIYADYIFGAGHVSPMQSDGDESYQGIPTRVWEAMNSDNQRAGLNILRAAHQATENRYGNLTPISRFIENLSYNTQGQIVATSDPKHSRGWAKGTVVTDDMLTQKLLEIDRDFDFNPAWDRTEFRPGSSSNTGETAAGRSGSGGVGPDTAKLVIMTNTILNRIENDPDATIPAAWVTRAKKIGREIGGWMFSQAEKGGAKGIDADEAVARVTAMVGDNVARVLLDSGMIDFVQTGAELTGETFSDDNGKVQGATTPDGKIILVLDNLSDKTFDAVLSHEAIHATLKNLLGDDTYNALMSRLDTLLKAGEGSQWVKDANARVPAGTNEQDRLEEIAGYAVELHVRGGTRGNPLVQWAKDFMSALRTAIIQNKALPEKLRMWAMQNIQPADLSRMAIAGLKRAAAETADKTPRQPDGSLNNLPSYTLGGKTIQPTNWAPATKVAEDYMASRGMAYNPPSNYVKVDPDRAARIAAAYDEMAHDPQDPEVKAAFAALAEETIAQYEAVMASGLKVEFMDMTKGDPYAKSPRLVIDDVRNNNHMSIFSTADGYGTDGEASIEDNPMLAPTKFKISGRTALVNDLFRVVHDYFGHVKEGVGFRADGEENAWRAHSAMFSPAAQRALTTETRGQNSWVNYGPYGQQNRSASGADTHYAPQKTGLLPMWVSEDGRYDTTKASKVTYAPVDTKSPAFKKWFKKSKVVNADGTPMKVYHGTLKDFGIFKVNSELGAHFGTLDQAVGFTEHPRGGGNIMPVYLSIQKPARLIDYGSFEGSALTGQLQALGFSKETYALAVSLESKPEALFNFVKLGLSELGYDGIVYLNRREGSAFSENEDLGGDEIGPDLNELTDEEVLAQYPDAKDSYIVFKPTQVKSAISNTGDFDRKNPDIRHSRRDWDAEIAALLEEHKTADRDRRVEINDELRSLTAFRTAQKDIDFAQRTGQKFSVGASYGTPREGAVSVVGVHFGNTQRNVLNSVAYGKGIKGEEAARLQGQNDIRPRTMFYVDEGNGVTKEPGLGNVGKQVRLNNLYDLREDALNLASNDLNAMERAIVAAGFDGYYRPNYRDMGQGVVVVVGKHDIPVEPYVPGEGAAPAPAYTGNQYGEALAKSKLPGGAMLGREWLVSITGTEFDTPPVRAQLEQRQNERVYRDDLPRFNRGLRYSMSEEHQAIDPPVAEELPNTLNILDLARRGPIERALEKLRSNIQDKHVTLRRIQQLASVVREQVKLDTIGALERLGSKLMMEQQRLVDAPLTKIESILTKAGFTAEEARKSLDDLLVARHAAEYNEHTATINPAKYDAAGKYLGGHDAKHPGSGVTDGQARDTIRLLTGVPGAKTTALLAAEEVYRQMIRDLQQFAVERGLEKQQTIDNWNEKFPFYTPFNRELNLEENLSVGSAPGAAGISLRSGIARRAMGSGADIISPLASTALWGLKTTQRGENAVVSRTFLEFAKFVTPNYMSADGKLKPMWSVEKIPNTRVLKKVNVYLVPKADGSMSPEFYNREQAQAYADMQQDMWEQANPGADPDTSGIEVQRPYSEPQNRVLIQPMPNYLNEPNVMVIPVEGENVIITFDPKSKDAMAILDAFKNKAGSGEGVQKLNKLLAIPRMFSRWIMATSTGYNPVFLVFNAARDIQAAAINAGADQIPGWTAGDSGAIAGKWLPAMKEINKRLLEEFKQLHSNDYTAAPVAPDSLGEWMDRMKAAGGATGITHSVVDVESAETQMRRLFGQAVLDQAKPIGSPNDFLTKMDEAVAKVGDAFYNFGQGETKTKFMAGLSKALPARVARWNEAAELTTRTLVFKRATELYMKAGHDVETAEKLAANISKNISTNFNRRGNWTSIINQLFPFFNAAANGTARLAETMWEKGTYKTDVNGQVMVDQKTKLTPYGKKVMGVIGSIGFLQSALLLRAGFDDDDIPEEIKERNFIIPIPGFGDKDYFKIPMPHGFNLLVNIGRNFGDAAYHLATGEPGKAAKNLYNATLGQLGALNPTGSAGNAVTDFLPAIADPFVSLAMNKDAFGRPIAKEDLNPANPTPGFTRAKEGASTTGRILAEGLNTLSGGNEDQKGFISPTPDQIDFVLGNIGGGVGREAMKAGAALKAGYDMLRGNEREVMPSQKMPLIGRLYGDAGEPSALRSKLFAVRTEVNETYARYKGLKERGLSEEAAAFKAEHPEISLRDDIERYARGNAKQTKARALAREEDKIAEVNRITNKQDAAIATLLDKYQKLK